MFRKIFLGLLSLAFLYCGTSVLAQEAGGQMSFATYQQLKASGNLPDMSNIQVIYPDNNNQVSNVKPTIHTTKASGDCFGYFSPNPGSTSNTVDDDESLNVTLNFDFCFYGDNYTDVYINDNGNITFDNASGAFTASGFPTSPEKMIAPFWADFHQGTFGSNGLIWYENLATALIVHWEEVGYYADHTDKLNTMMLIITDGVDPLLAPGNNVGLFMKICNGLLVMHHQE